MRVKTLEVAAIASSIALALSPALAYLLGAWDSYWKLVTNLGDEPAYVVLSILIYALASPDLGFSVLVALVTSGWTNALLKNAIALPRPPRELWKVEVSGYGFPSGHAQTSTAFWSFIALKLRSLSAALLGTAVVGLVAYSRLELMVHYPRDVVGGIAFGAAATAAAYGLLHAASKLSKRGRVLLLAAYGACVSALYPLYQDVMFPRLGGVLLGLSCYPLISPKLPEKAPLPARALAAVVALAPALVLTRAAGAAAPALQLVAYAVVVVVVLLAPLVGIPFSRGKTR